MMKIQRYSRNWPWRCFCDSKFREDRKPDSGSITALALKKTSAPRQQLIFKGQQTFPSWQDICLYSTVPDLHRKQQLVCIIYVNSQDFCLLTLQILLPLMRQDDNACSEMKTKREESGKNLEAKDSLLIFFLNWPASFPQRSWPN